MNIFDTLDKITIAIGTAVGHGVTWGLKLAIVSAIALTVIFLLLGTCIAIVRTISAVYKRADVAWFKWRYDGVDFSQPHSESLWKRLQRKKSN